MNSCSKAPARHAGRLQPVSAARTHRAPLRSGKFPVELWKGDYDNYISEIMDEGSGLYAFAAAGRFLLPAERRCTYTGKLTDPRANCRQRRRSTGGGFAAGTGAQGERKDRRGNHHHQFHAAGAARPRRLSRAHARLGLELSQMGEPGAGPGRARPICTSATGNFWPYRSAGWRRAMSARGSRASSRARPR
jgi:hypothetical protein